MPFQLSFVYMTGSKAVPALLIFSDKAYVLYYESDLPKANTCMVEF